MECTANVTDDVQCGYFEGNYVKRCDSKYCQEPERIEFESVPVDYMASMMSLLSLVVLSTLFLVFA